MSAQGNPVDEESTLPVGPGEYASGHVGLDESDVSYDLKNMSITSDMDIETEIVHGEIISMCPVDGAPRASTMALAGSGSDTSIECKVLDVEKLPKLSKWDTFKNKMYLGSAYGGTRMTSTVEPTDDLENLAAGSSKGGAGGSIFDVIDADPSFSPVPKSNRASWGKMKAIFGIKVDKEEKDEDTKLEEMEGEDDGAEKVPKRFSFAWLQKVFTGKRNGGEQKSEENDEKDSEEPDEELAIDC